MIRIHECILYRNFQQGDILEKMTALMNIPEGKEGTEEERETLFSCINGLVELAGSYGFSGNLWHNYLTYLLVNHENAFSMACEIRGAVIGSINEAAENDFRIFKEAYDFDLELFDRRQRLSAAIGAYKSAHGLPVRDKAREAEVLRTRGDMLPERRDQAERLMTLLMALSREEQA